MVFEKSYPRSTIRLQRTDELIPSGETSSYRSNPLDWQNLHSPEKIRAYVGRAKEVQKAEKPAKPETVHCEAFDEFKPVWDEIKSISGYEQ